MVFLWCRKHCLGIWHITVWNNRHVNKSNKKLHVPRLWQPRAGVPSQACGPAAEPGCAWHWPAVGVHCSASPAAPASPSFWHGKKAHIRRANWLGSVGDVKPSWVHFRSSTWILPRSARTTQFCWNCPSWFLSVWWGDCPGSRSSLMSAVRNAGLCWGVHALPDETKIPFAIAFPPAWVS